MPKPPLRLQCARALRGRRRPDAHHARRERGDEERLPVPVLEQEVRERREDQRRRHDDEHVERRPAEHLEMQPEAEQHHAHERHGVRTYGGDELSRMYSLIAHGHPPIDDPRCFAGHRDAQGLSRSLDGTPAVGSPRPPLPPRRPHRDPASHLAYVCARRLANARHRSVTDFPSARPRLLRSNC